MISTTGRRPATALPNAAPGSASSEIGVSKTRSVPCFSTRPGVTANTPPATATSSPKKTTRSSRASSSSSAWQIAAEVDLGHLELAHGLARIGKRRLPAASTVALSRSSTSASTASSASAVVP